MAIGAIELGTIARSQDYTTIKQNEDNKSLTQQSSMVHNMNRNAEQKTKQVHESENADWLHKKFDARDKGSNSYNGDGGQNRKKDRDKESDGRVLLKGQNSFDIKI